MNYLFLVLMLYMKNATQVAVVDTYVKCVPFSVKTVLPMTEKSLEMGKPSSLNFYRENRTKQGKIAYKILKKYISMQGKESIDYDLRGMIKFRLSDKTIDIFYLNWNKKEILYKGKIYSIPTNDLERALFDLSYPCK